MRRLCVMLVSMLACLPVWANTIINATSSCSVGGSWSDTSESGSLSFSHSCTSNDEIFTLGGNAEGSMPVPSFTTGTGAGVSAEDGGGGGGVDFYNATVLTDISVSATSTFIGTGGTGLAFLDGNLLIAGSGQSESSSPECTYSTSFGSFTGCFNTGGFNVPFSIPFTFGQSFTLFATMTLADGCGGPGGCANGFGISDAGLGWEYTGVYDASGNLIPGAAFSQIQTPESSTPSLVILGLLFILGRRRLASAVESMKATIPKIM